MNTLAPLFAPKPVSLPRCGVKHFSTGVGWYLWQIFPEQPNVIHLEVARPEANWTEQR